MAFPENTVNDIGIKHIWDKVTAALSGKVDKVSGKGLSTNDYTTTEKDKLAGIESGAQVNTVTSVAGKTGAVTLDKSDVGLGNVDNTSDLDKPISTATQTALNNKADASDVTEVDTTNSTLFLYRETPYEADRVFLDELVGGSVVWNQLVSHGNFDETTDWSGNGASISVSNNIGNVTFSSATGKVIHNVNVIANHVYITVATLKATASNSMPTLASYIGSSGIFKYISQNVTSFQTVYILEKQSSIFSVPQIQIRNAQNPLPSDSDVQVKNVMCFDLTQMFGTAIADYIYSLEQATAGSGIAWLKSYGFFTKDYYPYNAGELISVKTSGKKVVGFNQWDEVWEKGSIGTDGTTYDSNAIRSVNYTPVTPNTNYYLKVGDMLNQFRPVYYDKDKNFLYRETNGVTTFTTPNNCYFIKITGSTNYGAVYNNDICINISKTTGTPKNGDYVPYEEHTYDISNIELRGISKLVNNELVYDGDTYESNGDVTRKYGIVDLGTLDWTYNSGSGHEMMQVNFALWKRPSNASTLANGLCTKMNVVTGNNTWAHSNQGISKGADSDVMSVYTADIGTDPTAFKTAMSGVYLIYELATPTIETTDPFANPQICDKDGTEEFIDNRTVPVPVGHNSTYANLPSMMDGDFLNYMVDNFASKEYTDRSVEAVEKLIPQKTVLYDDVVDVGDDFNISIPSSFNYIIFELTISSASYYGTGSLMVTSWDDTLNILATSHESELRTCVLLPIRDRVEVYGDFMNEHGELKITAF